MGFGFEWLMLSSNIIEGNLWPLSVEGRGLLVIASDWIGAGNLITKLLTSSILLTREHEKTKLPQSNDTSRREAGGSLKSVDT